MGFKDVPYKAAYVSGVDNLVKDFYVPTLAESVRYRRRTAYFNSRALAMAARGLSGLLENDGKMQLLCSVQLDKAEEDVLKDPVAYLERRALDVADMLDQPYDELEKQRLGLLAYLLAEGKLEIQIAVKKGGIYHEKAGIFEDAEGHVVAFNGSGNETPGGWFNNTESFHVFTSWEDDRHIQPEIETFERLWEGKDPATTVIPLPFAVVKGLIEFQDYYRAGIDEPVDPADLEVVQARKDWEWTPELAYVFEAPRLWNHRDFAYMETAITPFDHQDYIASTVLEDWPPRVLLADEVGLGKTIELGLILKGFLAAGRVDRCLILAPASTLEQMQQELYTKFGLEVWRLDGDQVVGPEIDPNKDPPKDPVDAANPFRSKKLLLASSQLVRLDDRKEQVLGLEWDLVVLDEAHHARARDKHGGREPNKLLDLLEQLRYNTQGLILMTATPIQLDRRELWDLLNVLELPGRWQDEEAFDRFFAEVNADEPDWRFLLNLTESTIEMWGVDEASAKEVGEEFPGVDIYRLLHALKEKQVNEILTFSDEELEAFRLLVYRHTPIRQMVFRNTRELLKRYREEGKFDGKLADRDPSKETVALAGDPDDPTSEHGLYKRIDQYVREYYAKYDELRAGLGFIMETYRKRLTSSLHAIKLSLQRRRDRLREALETGNYAALFGDLTEDDLLDVPEDVRDRFAAELAGEGTGGLGGGLRELVETEAEYLDGFLHDLAALPNDSKVEHLDDLLGRRLSEGVRQVIVFSQFTDTVDFLLDYFLPKLGDRLGSYTGGGGRYWTGSEWAVCSKQEIQKKFRDPDDPLSVLICSDAASEGLNLQTCNTVINYDIPWNPMRIEQRIGRVDRINQEAPVVHIHTVFYEGTVEEKAYDRCLERIGYFKSALGHLQPILQATQKAIRRGALAASEDEEDAILAEMEKEYEESVAEVDEAMRIEQLLNHYSPRLPMMENKAPITQEELAGVLTPLLEDAGWFQDGDVWRREADVVTFDPKLLDEKGNEAELITPLSSITQLVGTVPELAETIEADGSTIHRLMVQGLAGLTAEADDGAYLAERITDFQGAPSGRRFGSVKEARQGLEHLIEDQRRQFLEADKQAWSNRRRNWEVRVGMYLDRVAHWKYRSEQVGKSEDLTEEEFLAMWNAYLEDPERQLAKRLAGIIGYRPASDVMVRRRGRVPKKSPRSTAKEEQMLAELERIERRLKTVESQLAAPR